MTLNMFHMFRFALV